MVVTAMLVTMLPVTASASVPDRDSGAVFKNMYMHSAATQRPVATYTYGDSINYFNSAAVCDKASTGGLEWLLMSFAIEKGQDGDLLLYRYNGDKDESAVLEAGQNLELEDFLEPIQDVKDGKAYLNAIHFKDNIDPSDAASTEEVTLSKDYDRKDLDIFERDPSKATMMKSKQLIN